MTDKRLVITVAPQDICPQGRTYPINAVAIAMNRINTLMIRYKRILSTGLPLV